jgi:hypothetical protein
MSGKHSRRWLAGLGALAALALGVRTLRAQATVCAEVKLEILQEATLEREAFDASLKINNNLPDKPFTKLKVLVFVKNDNGQPADSAFFIKVSTLSNTNAVDGTGVVQSSSTAEIHWLIIPSTGAGGSLPGGKRYSVKASITGESDGVAQTVNTFDDFITVYPQPSLKLEYVLPFEVFADEPLTTAIEPVEPFPLGVRVTNVGFGTAKNFKIDSAQPRITENKQNLAIDFRLLGTVVGGQTIPDTLLVPFGDVAAGGVGQASWVMATTLSGRFVSFTSTFTHAAELGGQLTSLIQSVTTYTLLRDVRVDLPGRDATPDFLVNATMDREAMKDVLDAGQVVPAQVILESDQAEPIPVQDLAGMVTGALGGTSSTLELGFAVGVGSNVWVRVSAPITPPAGLRLTSARAGDGRTLDVKNAWISKHFRKDDTTVLYRLNVLDLTSGASYYTLQFDPAGLDDFPGVVTDLAAETGPVGGTLALSWTAPGEDGYTGGILGGSYFIQSSISSAPVFLPEFAQLHLTTSTAPGRLESFLLTGLIGNATTQVALWTQDTGGLMSSTSNIASAYVAPYPPHDLVLSALSSVSVNGQWQTGNNSLPVEYQVYASSEAGVTSSASPFLDSFTSTHTFLLEPNRRYEFFGTARNPETGAMSAPLLLGAATSYAAPPAPEPYADVFFTSMTVVWGANGNPPDTEYWVELATAAPRLPNPVDEGWSTQVADWATGNSRVFTGLFAQTNYRARVKARNRDGFETALTDLGMQRTQKTDVMPPRTTLAFSTNSFGENPTYVSGRTSFTLTAVDDHREVGDADGVGGVVHLVSVDSGPFTAYSTAPFSLSPGSHTLSYFSVDFLDNEESSRTVSVFVDTAPPTVALAFVGAHHQNEFFARFVSAETQFAIEAADVESDGGSSGLGQVLVSTGGTSFVYTSTFSLPATRIVNGLVSQGRHVFDIRAYDNVFNEGMPEPIGEVIVDTIAPVSLMTFEGPSTRTPYGLFVRTFTPIRVQSRESRQFTQAAAMKRLRLSIDDSESFFTDSCEFIFGTCMQTAFALSEGTHTVVYRGEDNVENIEAAHTESIIADDSAPGVSISTETDGQVYEAATSTIPVRFTVVDALDAFPSVSALLVQTEDRGSPRGARPGSVAVVAGQDLGPFSLDDGLWRLQVTATDVIGNSSTTYGGTFEVTFPADSQPPRTSIVAGSPAQAAGGVLRVTRATPLSISALDDLHAPGDGLGYGVRSSSYAVNGSSYSLFTAPFFLSQDGSYQLAAFSEDVFGQAGAVTTATIVVDNGPPLIAFGGVGDGAVLATGTVTVTLAYSDPGGLDMTQLDIVVDNVSRKADASIGPSGASLQLQLNQGQHRLWASIKDKLGNQATDALYFDVTGGPAVTARVRPEPLSAPLGEFATDTEVTAEGLLEAAYGLETESFALTVDSAPVTFAVSTQSAAFAPNWSLYAQVTQAGEPASFVTGQGFAVDKERLFVVGGTHGGGYDRRFRVFDGAGVHNSGNLPFDVTRAQLAVVDNVAYIVSGEMQNAAGQTYSVEARYAFLDPAGAPIEWKMTTPLFESDGQPFQGVAHAATVVVPGTDGTRVFLIGGLSSSSGYVTSRGAIIQPDKSLGAWSRYSSGFVVGGVGLRAVYRDGRVYAAGGLAFEGGPALSAVHVITVDAQGLLTAAAAAPPMPHGAAYGSLFIVNDRLYYAGGVDENGPRSGVAYAPILPDGALGAWVEDSALPEATGQGGGGALGRVGYAAPGLRTTACSEGPSCKLSYLMRRSFDDRVTSAQLTASATLAEGAHVIAASGEDLFGVARTGTRTYVVDLTTPASHVETDGSSRTVEGVLQVAAQSALSIVGVDPLVGGAASGIAFTRVAVDGGAEQDGARFFVGAGSHTLSFYSRDRAGNQEAAQEQALYADGAAPAPAGDLSVLSVAQTQATLGWTSVGEDGLDGVISDGQTRIAYSTFTAGLSSAAAQYAAPLVGQAPGEPLQALVTGLLPGTSFFFALWTRDTLGNWSGPSNVAAAYTPGTADETPPVTALLVSTGATLVEGQAFYPGSAYFGFTSTDAESGVAAVEYRLDGSTGAFLVYAGTFSLAEGARSLEYLGVDAAGNREAASTGAFVVDASAPLTVLEALGPSATDGQGRLVVSTYTLLALSAADLPAASSAGVAATYYSVAGPLGPGSAVYAAPFALAPGTYTLRFASADRVGNREAEKMQELSVSTRLINAPPAAVSDLLAATAVGGGSLALSWTAPDDDAAPGVALDGAYLLQRSTEASPVFDPSLAQVELATAASPGASQTLALTGLLGNATHQLRLWTRDGEGATSAVSNAASAYARPNPPSDGVITALSSTSLSVAWTPGENLGVAHRVSVATAPAAAPVSESGDLLAPDYSYTFTGLAPGTTYFVSGYARDPVTDVRSAAASFGSTRTAPASFAPAALDLLATAGTAPGSVVLTWTAGNAASTGAYLVHYTSAGAGALPSLAQARVPLAGVAAGQAQSATLYLAPNTPYAFTLWLQTPAGTSPPSNAASALTFAAPPVPALLVDALPAVDLDFFPNNGVAHLALDPADALWATWFNGSSFRRIPPPFTDDKTPDVVFSWVFNDLLGDILLPFTFDAQGNAWAQSIYTRSGPRVSYLLKFKPPFVSGARPEATSMAFDMGDAKNMMAWDPDGGLWMLRGLVAERYLPPFSHGMQPVATLTGMRFNNRGLAVDRGGRVWIGDSDRFLVYDPPFTGTMAPSAILSGIASFQRFNFDRSGTLWVEGNAGQTVQYEPPYASGMTPRRTFTQVAGYPVVDAEGALWTTQGPSAVKSAASGVLAAGASDITLAWKDNANPAGTRYEVQVATDPAFTAPVTSGLLTSSSAVLGGLRPSTTYYARGRAFDAADRPSAFLALGSTRTAQAPPPPSLTSITPSSATAGEMVLVAAAGAQLSSGATLALERPELDAAAWAAAGSFGQGRFFATLVKLLDGRALLAGGMVEGDGTGLAQADLYDPTTGAWTAAAPMNLGRRQHAAALLADGRVLQAGGVAPGNVTSAGAEAYDPATGAWTTLAPMAQVRAAHVMARLADGRVLAAGGWSGASPLASAERFDPASGAWSSAGTMSDSRINPAMTVLRDGRVLVSGGNDNSGTRASADLYDPVANTWTPTGAMGGGRYGHHSALLPDGRVLVSGGADASGSVSTAEVYDPVTGAWTPTGPLSVKRYFHGMVLAAGVPVIVGGENQSVSLGSTEIYDAASNSWRPGPSLTDLRAHVQNQAVLLDDGRVLVAGGRRGLGGGVTLNTSELLSAPTAAILATGVSVAGPESLSGVLDLTGAATGYWDAVVRSGGRTARLEGGFRVLAAPQAPVTLSAISVLPSSATVLVGAAQAFAAVGTYSDGSTRAFASAAGSWEMAAPLATGRADAAGAFVDGRFYVIGGAPPSGSATTAVETYDPATGAWSARASAPVSRAGAAAAVHEGKVYVVGGCINSDCGSVTGQLWVYDPAADAWTQKASMPNPRYEPTFDGVGGKLYAVGGFLPGHQVTGLVQEYDPVLDAWTNKASMPFGRGQAAAGVIGGKLYVANGQSSTTQEDELQVYDPATDSWSQGPVSPLRRQGDAGAVVDGKLYVIGGISTGAVPSNGRRTLVFDPAAGAWSEGPALSVARYGPSVAAGAGRIFVAAGGFTNNAIADHETLSFASEVAWSVDQPAVATVTAAGLATGLAPGTAQVVASSGAVSGAAALFVVSPDSVAPSAFITFSTPSFAFADGSLAVGTRAFVALDSDDPGAALRYAVDAPLPALPYSGPFTLEAGTRTVYFSAEDAAGNESAVSSRTVFVASGPFVGSVDRSSGPIGQPLVIRGFNFRSWTPPLTALRFGASTAPVTVWNDAQVSASVPGLASGEYALTLDVRQDGASVSAAAGVFTVLTPAIASVTPSSGPIGAVITVLGTAFGPYGGANTRLLIGGATAPVSVWNDGRVVGTVPGVLEPGAHELALERRTADGGLARSNTFFFEVAGLSIAALSPSTGPIGVPFTLTGSGFGVYGGAATQVLFGSTAASISVWSDGSISGTVPSLSTGAHAVVVRRAQGGGEELSAPALFTLTPLVLEAPMPSSAPIGAPFVLSGSGFGPYGGAATRLLLGGATAAVSVWNDTTIAGTVPPVPAGAQPLWIERLTGGGLQASATIYFDVLAPAIASVAPSSGAIGAVFTLEGSGFGPYAGAATRVLVGGATAPVSVWNDGRIVATVPGSLPSGVHELAVERAYGGALSRSATAAFTVVGQVIAAVSPSTGPVGIPFTVTGTGFGAYGGSATRILFGGTTAPVSVWNDTTITGTIPLLSTGAHAVIVERVQPAGVSASNAGAFTLTPLSLTAPSPSSAPAGVSVTLSGTGFGPYGGANTRLLLGGATVPVSVWNDATITAAVPVLPPGPQPVWIERRAGGGVQASNTVYIEVLVPSIAAVTPSSAPIGAPFTLTGSGFGVYGGAATRVKFGGVTAAVSLWNDSTISGTVPGALSTGPTTVLVERAVGAAVSAGAPADFEVLRPAVATVTPSFGPAGTLVTLSGHGFGPYAGTATRLLVGGSTMTVSVWNDTTIRWTVPAGLPDGTHEVYVTRQPSGGSVASEPVLFSKGTGFGGAALGFEAPLAAKPDVYFEGELNLPAEEGGRVETPALAAVSVPPGALASDTVITVARERDHHRAARAEALHAGGLGAAGEPIKFGPDGTRFAVPVTIELPYDPSLFPGGTPATLAVHYYDPLARAWTPLSTQIDAARRVLIARTDHFSLYQPLAPGIAVAAVDDFSLRDQYVFPNPSRRGQAVTFRVQPGRADSLELRVYDLAGRKVHQSSAFTFAASYDDGNGKGPQHTYDHVWNVSGVGSGVYYYVIVAKRAGQGDITVKGKAGVIK